MGLLGTGQAVGEQGLSESRAARSWSALITFSNSLCFHIHWWD